MGRIQSKFSQAIERLNNLSYGTMFLLWFGNVALFSCIYIFLSYVPNNGPFDLGESFERRVWNAIYYSIITATNTGYGDILPYGLSRLFASLEAVTGLFLFAVFVTKLVSRRQDIALHEIHQLTFENTFHNMREDLHVVRTDFDHAIKIARKYKHFSEYEFNRLAVAYRHIAGLIEEMPHFYGAASKFYIIDHRREELLLEATHRTLVRTNEMLTVLSEEGIKWGAHEESVVSLRELLDVVEKQIPLWEERSQHDSDDHFEQICHLGDSIRTRVQQELPV